jgi:beta-galactosidase
VSVGDRGERLVYVFNEDNFERRVGLRFEEEPLFGGKELLLRAREVAAEMNYP